MSGRSRSFPHSVALDGVVERLLTNVRFYCGPVSFKLKGEPTPCPQGPLAPVLAFKHDKPSLGKRLVVL